MGTALLQPLLQSARRAKNRFISQAIILLYHRIIELPLDPNCLVVSPENFGEQLAALRDLGRLISLQDLVCAFANDRIPHRAIAVTFDDGYADNLVHARPLLARYGVPATVFVATGSLTHDSEFWWDELETILLRTGMLPSTLELHIRGMKHRWELGPDAYYSEASSKQHMGWNLQDGNDPTRRHSAYRELSGILRRTPDTERHRLLEEMRSWAAVEPRVRGSHRRLTPDELLVLVENGLIEVGAHTMSHPVLAGLPGPDQRTEILGSKRALEEALGRPVRSFAYPFGGLTDYDRESIAAVQDAGFTCACANFSGSIRRRGADRFQLPRLIAGNWNGEEFARRIENWFRG